MTAPGPSDWFEALTGFREEGYEVSRSRLEFGDHEMRSRANGARHGTGTLELISLQALRERAVGALPGRLRVRCLSGDVRRMHRDPEYAGALFQVASQFNLLEMSSPDVTPEHGVTRYQHDHTQGPACAMAAGAATLYRQYGVPLGGRTGQTHDRQLDALADVGTALQQALGCSGSGSALWTMRNGYALCTSTGLAAIGNHLAGAGEPAVDALRGLLRIGLHSDVEVTDVPAAPRPRVSQALCSALPVAYSEVPAASWQAFAALVLEAAYEATLWAAVANARRGVSSTVLLTRLGGGAFGNPDGWIDAAMRRALALAAGCALDVRLVSHGTTPQAMHETAAMFD